MHFRFENEIPATKKPKLKQQETIPMTTFRA